jgi:Tol biopolymer transport system component
MEQSSNFLLITTAITMALATSEAALGANDSVVFGEPVNLGPAINTANGEGSPKVSANGLELYFNSNRPGGSGGQDLWVSRRESPDAPWEPATNLGPVVNSAANEGAPSISSDGLELYFHDWGAHRPGGAGETDVWLSRRASVDDPWGEPVNLGEVNSSANDGTPEISADMLELYFESERPGGFGSDDIWVVRRDAPDGAWGTPENLGQAINTSEWEHCPSISADGLTLFFDLRIPGDLVVTQRASTSDPWDPPVNLGHEESDHWASSVTKTGDMLYFSANRPGGQGEGDIWQVPILSGLSR